MVDGVFHDVLVGVHMVVDWLFIYIGHCVVGWGVPVSVIVSIMVRVKVRIIPVSM